MNADELLAKVPVRVQHNVTFKEYLDLVIEIPSIVRSSHALLRDAILSKGYKDLNDPSLPHYRSSTKRRVFGAFENDIYGINDVLEEIMRRIESAANGDDTRRRILLLIGPPGAGKSDISTHLKRILEDYTETDEGAVYGIVGCPIHEEPLHLLPQTARDQLSETLNIKIEGDLCPVCTHRLNSTKKENGWENDVANVRVERIYLSEQRKVGIGTFSPGDPNTQSEDDLIGNADFLALQRIGVESHPLAWCWDGSIEVGNRGICELRELLKAKNELLNKFIDLAQERQIKVGRFPLLSIDEVLIAHVNEEELDRFRQEKKNRAIADRVIRVDVPYNLCWDAEVRIYEKMLKGLSSHIAPWTLKAAAAWALLSRYQTVEKYMPDVKLRLYNSEYEGMYTPIHYEEARQLSPRDGMQGISPRQVINAITQASAASTKSCINPLDALRALRQSSKHHLAEHKTDELDKFIGEVRTQYDRWVEKIVSKAFVEAFDSAAQNIWQKYLDNAEAILQHDKIKDPVTEEWQDPDESFLRSVENQIGITSSDSRTFREEIVRRAGMLARKGQRLNWDSHPRMKSAIEKRLFGDLQGTIRTTLSGETPDEEQRKRLSVVKDRLKEDYGFCETCAQSVLDYSSVLFKK